MTMWARAVMLHATPVGRLAHGVKEPFLQGLYVRRINHRLLPGPNRGGLLLTHPAVIAEIRVITVFPQTMHCHSSP